MRWFFRTNWSSTPIGKRVSPWPCPPSHLYFLLSWLSGHTSITLRRVCLPIPAVFPPFLHRHISCTSNSMLGCISQRPETGTQRIIQKSYSAHQAGVNYFFCFLCDWNICFHVPRKWNEVTKTWAQILSLSLICCVSSENITNLWTSE